MTAVRGCAVSRGRITARAPVADAGHTRAHVSLDALGAAGLFGLSVPAEYGGAGAGLSALAEASEAISRRCASTGMTLVMHVVTAAAIARGGGPRAEELLRALAGGDALGALAPGAHGAGRTTFAASSSAADVYLVLVRDEDGLEADCFAVERDDRMSFEGSWDRLGTAKRRGSITMTLEGVADEERIGAPGGAGELVLDVVAPWLLTGLGAVNVGVAAAQAAAVARALERTFGGPSVQGAETLHRRLADHDSVVRRTRLLVREAAALGDAGDPDALVAMLEAKQAAAKTAREILQWATALRRCELRTPHVM
jgi:alkylation response protein AidB-like acyl-CoA dehydrogenase